MTAIIVIARREATKQSSHTRTSGLLHRYALRNDGKGEVPPHPCHWQGEYFPNKQKEMTTIIVIARREAMKQSRGAYFRIASSLRSSQTEREAHRAAAYGESGLF
jgi:hypothetical protein